MRYADDLIICCRYQRDAERIKIALGRCLAKYGLKINESKTRLVQFSKRKQKQGEQQQTFDFLGFTFYIGKSRKGYYLIKVKTAGKRIRSKPKKVNDWARRIRNKKSLKEIIEIAAAKVRGHIQYYGVSHNVPTMQSFLCVVNKILFKWLNRRSQRKSFTWEKFQLFLDRMAFQKAKSVTNYSNPWVNVNVFILSLLL